MRLSSLVLCAGILAVLGAGCVSATGTSMRQYPPLPIGEKKLESVWVPLEPGLDRLESQASSTEARMILYRFAADKFVWKFLQTDVPKTLPAWSDAISEPVLFANGVYFHEDHAPSGFLVSGGIRIGTRSFDADKSGLIALSPRVRIIDTATSPTDLSKETEAAQSYPFLIKQGQVAISTDSGLYARRTFFGVDKQGNVYLGVVPDGQLTLRGLAERLLTVGVAWNQVINLDGGPSTGVLVTSPGHRELIESYTPIPNVLTATRK